MAHQSLNANMSGSQSEADEDSDSNASDQGNSCRRQIIVSSSSRTVPQSKTTKTNNIFSVGQDIKEGLIEMSSRLASTLNGQHPFPNNDLQEIKQRLKEQAQQIVETQQMLRLFLQAMMQK